MTKTTLLLTLGLFAMFSGRLLAQDSRIWLDTRDNITSAGTGIGGQLIAPGAPTAPYINGQNPAAGMGNSADRFGTSAINGGARGAGGVLRLNPAQVGGWEATTNPTGSGSGWPNYDLDINSATGCLWYYMDVGNNANCPGGNIDAIGIDTSITQTFPAIPMRNTIASVTMTVPNDATVGANAPCGMPNPPWLTVSGPTTVSGPLPVVSASMSGPAPVFGLPPCPAGPYRIAKLCVTAGLRNCNGRVTNTFVDGSTYSVKISMSNPVPGVRRGPCAGVFDNVSIGYDPLIMNPTYGTLDAPINGGTPGNTSASPDAAIQIRLRGDFNGDGNVSGADVGGFNNAVGGGVGATAKVAQIYLGDFNNSRSVTGADIAGFNSAVLHSGTCP